MISIVFSFSSHNNKVQFKPLDGEVKLYSDVEWAWQNKQHVLGLGARKSRSRKHNQLVVAPMRDGESRAARGRRAATAALSIDLVESGRR